MRVTTDTNGMKIGEQGHYPFGENRYSSSTTTKFRFTSYERDTESGNDYAIFRTHINRLGRFNRPDPVAGTIADPQSLNRYAYVLNDPVNFVDPIGLVRTIRVIVTEFLGTDPKSMTGQWLGIGSGGGPGVLLNGNEDTEDEGGNEEEEQRQPCDAQLPTDPNERLLAQTIFGEATASGISEEDSKREMAAIGYAAVNRQAQIVHLGVAPSFFRATGPQLQDVINRDQFRAVGGQRFNQAANPSQFDTSTPHGKIECDNLKRAIAAAKGVLSRRIDDPFAVHGGTFAFDQSTSGTPGTFYFRIPDGKVGEHYFYGLDRTVPAPRRRR